MNDAALNEATINGESSNVLILNASFPSATLAINGGSTLTGSMESSLSLTTASHLTLTSSGMTAELYGAAQLDSSLSQPVFRMTALVISADTNYLEMEQPESVFSAFGAGYLSIDQSASFSAEGIVSIIGHVQASIESAFSATGIIGSAQSLNLSQPQSTFLAFSGANLGLDNPVSSFSSNGIVGISSDLTLIQTSSFVSQVDSNSIVGRITASLPGMSVFHGSLALQQESSFTASSTAIVNNLIAYSMNIKTAETTVYTNYSFDFIVRIGHSFYGVKNDGLYALEGNTDEDVAIAPKFRTSESDFGSFKMKSVPYAYIDSDLPTDIQPIADGVGDEIYSSSYGNKRTHLSRGLLGKIFAFELSSSSAPMKVGSIELIVEEKSRRV